MLGVAHRAEHVELSIAVERIALRSASSTTATCSSHRSLWLPQVPGSTYSRTSAMIIHFVMPFWGDPGDLRDAVESVRSQTDPDWILTVIDDCFPDDSIANFFAELNDPRVDYRRNERNVGITENFRRAVSAARADYAVVLGSDDIVGPSYVACMKAAVSRHPNVDVFQGGIRVIDSDGRATRTLVDAVKGVLTPRSSRTFEGEEMASTLLVGNWLYWPSLLFRTSTLQQTEFRDDLPIILDLALLIDVAMAGGSLHSFREEVFSYRRHSSSLSQKALTDGSRFDDERKYYRALAAELKDHGWKSAHRAAKWRPMSRLHGLASVPGLLMHGSIPGAKAAFKLSFWP